MTRPVWPEKNAVREITAVLILINVVIRLAMNAVIPELENVAAGMVAGLAPAGRRQ